MISFWVKALIFMATLDLLLIGNSMCSGATLADDGAFPYHYWEAARDGHLLFCTEGIDPGWVEHTLEHGWRLQLTYECTEPDLIIKAAVGLTHPDIDGMVCGLAHVKHPCVIDVETYCMDSNNFYWADTPAAVLDHEVGHCLGFGHRDSGVMHKYATSLPTEEDIALVHERYGLNVGLTPVPAPGEWTLSRWASQPTSADALALDVLAAYNLRDGVWLRYFPDAPAEINTLLELQRDQPVFVLGR